MIESNDIACFLFNSSAIESFPQNTIKFFSPTEWKYNHPHNEWKKRRSKIYGNQDSLFCWFRHCLGINGIIINILGFEPSECISRNILLLHQMQSNLTFYDSRNYVCHRFLIPIQSGWILSCLILKSISAGFIRFSADFWRSSIFISME